MFCINLICSRLSKYNAVFFSFNFDSLKCPIIFFLRGIWGMRSDWWVSVCTYALYLGRDLGHLFIFNHRKHLQFFWLNRSFDHLKGLLFPFHPLRLHIFLLFLSCSFLSFILHFLFFAFTLPTLHPLSKCNFLDRNQSACRREDRGRTWRQGSPCGWLEGRSPWTWATLA